MLVSLGQIARRTSQSQPRAPLCLGLHIASYPGSSPAPGEEPGYEAKVSYNAEP